MSNKSDMLELQEAAADAAHADWQAALEADLIAAEELELAHAVFYRSLLEVKRTSRVLEGVPGSLFMRQRALDEILPRVKADVERAVSSATIAEAELRAADSKRAQTLTLKFLKGRMAMLSATRVLYRSQNMIDRDTNNPDINIKHDPSSQDWISPPCDSIEDGLEERGFSPAEFAELMELPLSTINELLDNQLAISPDIAERLARVIGCTPSFWLRRQKHYEELRDDGKVRTRIL